MNTQVEGRRPAGALGRMGVVAGLHVAALYLIASSLGIVPPLIVEPPTATLLEPETMPPDETPPIPQPRDFETPPLAVPPPDEFIIDSAEPPPDAIFGEISDDPPRPEIIPATQGPVLVGVRPDPRRPLTQPAYPPSDVRQGKQGSAEIEIYVLPDGRIGDARLLKSTGSPTLDQSAVDEAKRKWRMLPATRDGVPYAQWHRLRVVFNLRDR
jgi:protein TonB